MAHIDVFKGWAESIRQDIDALKALLESEQAAEHARLLAGAALSYLVSRMDLVPDWNEGIGVMDDVMVLRVAAQLAQNDERGSLSTSADASLDRLVNEADKVTAFLGAPIYDKLKSHVAKLAETSTRGRTPAQLVSDEAARAQLYTELDDELKRSVPVVIEDPADAELRLKAYLTHKLQ